MVHPFWFTLNKKKTSVLDNVIYLPSELNVMCLLPHTNYASKLKINLAEVDYRCGSLISSRQFEHELILKSKTALERIDLMHLKYILMHLAAHVIVFVGLK